MQDVYTMLSSLRRPRLLISAARHGLMEYDRQRQLQKLLNVTTVPSSGAAAMRLMEIEAGMNQERVEHGGGYSIARHVDVLVALMAEADLLRPRPRPVA
ncbi:MAG: DUF6477 family protein [Pseudomonadota bacterium]